MKVLVTLRAEGVAPRFDLATEVLVAEGSDRGDAVAPRNVIMPGPSGDELCALILRENVDVVVCGGIEEPFYEYLKWKKVRVIDRVIGSARAALDMALEDRLKPGAVIRDNGPVSGLKGRV